MASYGRARAASSRQRGRSFSKALNKSPGWIKNEVDLIKGKFDWETGKINFSFQKQNKEDKYEEIASINGQYLIPKNYVYSYIVNNSTIVEIGSFRMKFKLNIDLGDYDLELFDKTYKGVQVDYKVDNFKNQDVFRVRSTGDNSQKTLGASNRDLFYVEFLNENKSTVMTIGFQNESDYLDFLTEINNDPDRFVSDGETKNEVGND